MYLLRILPATIYFLFSASLALADNEAHVIYEKSSHKHEIKIEENIKVSGVADEVVNFINEKFRLSKPLTFIFGGIDGPLYDTSSNEILVPYAFIEEVRNRFKTAKYSETGVTIEDATLDSVMHTMFHEFAHALIFTYMLPVVGKEEDAADGLANVLLIEFFDNGSDIVVSAADLFNLESGDIDEFEEEDFWDEHSLDAQRFYNALCYVYGSDPKEYTYLIKEIGFSEERADLCIDEYESVLRSWLSLLKPYFKNSS
jgi:hypothetical protein